MAANFSTNQDFIFKTKHNHSKLVCASQGAAGLGMLTDHGYKLHGWSREDYESMHNHGRGSMLYEFRNFMVTNIGLDVKKLASVEPLTITFAASTSRTSTRSYDFGPQILAIRDAFGSKVIVQKIDFAITSLQEQVRIASESAIYVTACGGGAVTAMFLPQGSSVVLYFVEDGGREDNRVTGGPAMLDWDLFNNMAWVRSHWLPARTMNAATDIDILVKLVAHELDIISEQIL
ncbi:DUF563-containing protein [Fragilaria crotonensis]|nr:DUF563-containing protein [Fragilaria crotonensis]